MHSSTSTKRIACFGEAMVELMLGDAASKDASLGYAGDTLNSAIYLKRLLGNQADVSFITKLGNDPLSLRTKKFIESESVITSGIEHSPDRSIGLYAIETDQSGERTFSYWRGQSAARTLFSKQDTPDFSALNGFDIICFSAISLAILPADIRHALLKELERLRKEEKVRVVFDSNYRPALWENKQTAQTFIADAWRVTDIALPSIDDEQLLFGDKDEAELIERLRSYGITQGALKRGEMGPKSLQTEDAHESPTDTHFQTAEKIIDTTAAGDSFNAGFLSSFLQDNDNESALLAGHACSLRVIANSGAIIPKEQW